MISEMFAVALSLFLLMDSFGNIPIYLSVLREIPKQKHPRIIIREMLIALLLVILFACFGNDFFIFLGIAHEAMYIAGGVVLFVMSLKMIFPGGGNLQESFGNIGDPLVFPLAVPLVSGPSVLAAVMIYSTQVQSSMTLFGAILISWFFTSVILLGSSILLRFLGERGIKALERLMGLVLMLIAINMFIQGWRQICMVV